MSPEVSVKHEDGRIETVTISREAAGQAAVTLVFANLELEMNGQGLSEKVNEDLHKIAKAINPIKP